MAHFTHLDAEAILEIAKSYALGILIEWKPIDAGTINSNYQVTTDRGTFFLRVNEGKSLAQVEYEIALVQHWSARGVPAPMPLESSNGKRYLRYRDHYLSVFPWLPGSHVDSNSIRPAHCFALGRTLAGLHIAGLDADASLQVETRYSESHLRELFASFASSQDPQLAQAIEVAGDEFAFLARQEGERSQLERGLIHADLFPDNVLLDGEELLSLLDFEQACRGALLYDLAVCINAWCFAQELVPERYRALVDGYLSGRNLADIDRGALQIELRAAALRFTITRITDVYLQGESAASKDFRRFLMRLCHWRDAPAIEPV